MVFSPKDLKSDEYRARHPLGRVPVLEDGDVSIPNLSSYADRMLARLACAKAFNA